MANIAWDPSNAGGWSLSNNNLTAVSPNRNNPGDIINLCFATPTIPSGAKVYYEVHTSGAALLTAFEHGVTTNRSMPNVTDGLQSDHAGQAGIFAAPSFSSFITFSYNGRVKQENTLIQTLDAAIPPPVVETDPDVVGILLDRQANTIQFRYSDSFANPSWGWGGGQYTTPVFDISNMGSADFMVFTTSWNTAGPVATLNGGAQGAFTMGLPSGFTALDTFLSGGSTGGNPAPAGYTITVPPIADKTGGVPFSVDIAFTYAANMSTLQWSNEQTVNPTFFRPVSAASGGTATLSTDQHTLTLPLLSGALTPHNLIIVDTQFSPSLQSNSRTFNVVASGGGGPAQALSFSTPPPASVVSGTQFTVVVAFTVALADFSTLQINTGFGLVAVNSSPIIVAKSLSSSGMSANITLTAAGSVGANTLLFRETVSGAQTVNANYAITAAPVTTATAVVSYVQLLSNSYQYSISLHNSGTTPIGTFWFAWVPFAGYLPSLPVITASPAGWSGAITDGPLPSNGYSIRWNATSLLAPGATLANFTFTSSTPPSVLFANSAIHPGASVAVSTVYSVSTLDGLSGTDSVFTPTNGGGTFLQSLIVEAIGTQTVNVVFTVIVDLANPVTLPLTGFRYRLDGGAPTQIPSSAVLSTDGLQIHFALTDTTVGSSETIQVLDPNSIASNIVTFSVNSAGSSNMAATDFFNTTSYPPGTANDADVLLLRDTVSNATRTQTRANFRAALDKVRTISGSTANDTPSASDVYGRIIHNGTAALTMAPPVLPAQSWFTVQQGANASITMTGVTASDGATAPFRTTRKGQVVAVDYLADGTIAVSGFAAGGGYRSVATTADTPTLADNGGVIAAKASSTTTFTINDLGENASYTVNAFGTAMPAFAAGSGVTFRHATDNTILASPFSLPRQNSYAVFYCRGDGTVIVGGVLT